MGLDKLRLLELTYRGFDDRPHHGRLIVNRRFDDEILAVFKRLYRLRYPIRNMELIDRYGADDHRSMAADNTSAFNCRFVAGTQRWSMHAYGLAIDLNPVENPYVSGSHVSPPAGEPYADRSRHARGMIHAGDGSSRRSRARPAGSGSATARGRTATTSTSPRTGADADADPRSRRPRAALGRPGDAAALDALITADRERLARFMPWAAGQTIQGTREFIRAAIEQEAGENGFQAVLVVDDGALAGTVGFHRIDRANLTTSIGYWLAAPYEGRGLMTAAVAALRRRTRSRPGACTGSSCGSRPTNERSRALAARLGFTEEGVMRGAERFGDEHRDLIMHSLLRREWRARASAHGRRQRELDPVLAEVDRELRVEAVAVALDEPLRLHLGRADEAAGAVRRARSQLPVRPRLARAPVLPPQMAQLQRLAGPALSRPST